MAGFSKKDEKFREYALTASPMKVLLVVAFPLALYQALEAFFKILDAMMASHIGSSEVSAVACLSQITLMINALGTGLAVGGSIKISEAYGQGDSELVRRRVSTIYAMAVLVAGVIALTLVPFAEPFLRLLRTPEDLIKTGAGYFRVEILSLVVGFFNTVFIAIERSRGHSRRILMLNMGVIAVKLSLTAFFVYVVRGGLILIAVATLIGQLLVLVYATFTMRRDDGAFRFTPGMVSLTRQTVGPMLNLAYPVSAEKMLFAAGKVIVNAMSGMYGALTVGALGISNNIGGLTTQWHLGFTDGAAPLISQNRGAGKYKRTLQVYFSLVAVDVIIGMIGLGIVSVALPAIADVFAHSQSHYDAAFRDMIVSIHRWEMLGYITLGINSATMALLIGYGYTKRTMILNVVRVFAYRVPVLWAFQRFTSLGVEAVGMTMMVSNVMTGVTAIGMAIPVVKIMRCDSDSGKKLIKSMVLRTADRQGMC